MLILENDELKSISRKEFLKRQKNLGMIYAMSDIHGWEVIVCDPEC